MDDAKKWLEANVVDTEQFQKLKAQVDSTTNEAVQQARKGLAVMEAATVEQVQEAKSLASWLSAEYKKYDQVVFDELKSGVKYAAQEPIYLVGAGTVALLFGFRGTRRLLYKATVGRLRSEETEILRADNRLKELRTSVEVHNGEARKLQERANAAETEFLAGRRKLVATAAELRRLLRNAAQKEAQAQRIREIAREFPISQSMRLRAEAAQVASEAKSVKYTVGRRIGSISRYNIL